MNKKWSEKTTLEKVMDIISIIALCVWFVFERIEGKDSSDSFGLGSCISITVVCVCQAFSYWNVKRVFSYVAIAGAVLLVTTMILGTVLFA